MTDFKNLEENEDYQSAEILASLILEDQTENVYLLANSLFQTKQYKRAIVCFYELIFRNILKKH